MPAACQSVARRRQFVRVGRHVTPGPRWPHTLHTAARAIPSCTLPHLIPRHGRHHAAGDRLLQLRHHRPLHALVQVCKLGFQQVVHCTSAAILQVQYARLNALICVGGSMGVEDSCPKALGQAGDGIDAAQLVASGTRFVTLCLPVPTILLAVSLPATVSSANAPRKGHQCPMEESHLSGILAHSMSLGSALRPCGMVQAVPALPASSASHYRIGQPLVNKGLCLYPKCPDDMCLLLKDYSGSLHLLAQPSRDTQGQRHLVTDGHH